MYVDIRGLLLIAANGDMYFIEGGIRANKVTNADIDAANPPQGVEPLIEYRAADDKVKALEDSERGRLKLPLRTYGSKPDPNRENIGPIIMHAYNVVLRREENGTSMITGNTTNFDVSFAPSG